MSYHYILDDAGNPVRCDDQVVFAEFFQDKAKRQIAEDKMDNGFRVSTVFLGIDHAMDGGTPVLFETMIFGEGSDQWQDRYRTKAEAVAGHRRVVDCLLAGGWPDF